MNGTDDKFETYRRIELTEAVVIII